MEDRNNIGRCGVCIALIILNCLISIPAFFADSLYEVLALIPERVAEGEYYRLLTCMFVHGDMTHLLGNMIGIFCIGQIVEMRDGHIRMMLIYLATGLFASLFITVTSSELPTIIEMFGRAVMINCTPDTLTIGASGAVFGLMAEATTRMLRTGDAVKLKGMLFNLAINLYTTFTVEGISVAGHVGGLLAGIVFGLL